MKRASTIPAGLTLVGNIEGDADLVILGRVEGEVRVGGSLLVDHGGTVQGDVVARAVTIRGSVAGDAFGSEMIRVDEGGRVVGDVTAPRVKVVEGARLRGRVRMEEGALPPRPAGPASDTVPGSADAPTVSASAAPAPDRSPQSPPAPRMPSLKRQRARRRRPPSSR